MYQHSQKISITGKQTTCSFFFYITNIANNNLHTIQNSTSTSFPLTWHVWMLSSFCIFIQVWLSLMQFCLLWLTLTLLERALYLLITSNVARVGQKKHQCQVLILKGHQNGSEKKVVGGWHPLPTVLCLHSPTLAFTAASLPKVPELLVIPLVITLEFLS